MRALPHGVIVLALACGCVTLQRGGLFPADQSRVFVAYFDNGTFYRDVEFEVTEAVVAEILSRPGLHLSSKQDADVLLTGRVVKVQQNVLSEDATQTVTSSSTTITVVIELWDARSGDLLKQARLSQRGEFVPSLGENIEDAEQQAMRFLARDIVRELELEF